MVEFYRFTRFLAFTRVISPSIPYIENNPTDGKIVEILSSRDLGGETSV